MAKDTKRFEKIYSQGAMTNVEIWVDREGKPVISPLQRRDPE